MAHIVQNSLATIYFTFIWKSSHATHIERYLAHNVSFTGDTLPLGIKSRMMGLHVGDSVTLDMDPSEVPTFKPGKILDMPRERFQPPLIHGRYIKPRIGRFYPKHHIENVPGTRPDSVTPFRVVANDRSGFKADLNHPMAGREVSIRAEVIEIGDPADKANGLTRWSEVILSGPGMEARLEETPTDYLGADPFKRDDESGDAEFYAKIHAGDFMDDRAVRNVQRVYGDLLKDGMKVLDLMAAKDSHLPVGVSDLTITGLGLNGGDMASNPALTDHVIHNLNEDPVLPFDENSFDAIICTGGVGYLVKPFEILEEAARILKPGGVIVFTFIDKWVEEKVIRVWTELYEFERMGLVTQYFVRSEMYDDLTTLSERGWLTEDGSTGSSPVFAVWGTAK